jgi:type I site-specific restriction endonuclease
MDPEQKARLRIDQQLEQASWLVQDYREMFIAAGLGVAVREFSLLTGEADHLLYVDGQIIGVIEAKPEGHTLTGVETQSAKYTDGLPPDLPCWRRPLPFAYESTGAVTQFANTLDPDPRSREVFAFHRPEELLQVVGSALVLDDPSRKPNEIYLLMTDELANRSKAHFGHGRAHLTVQLNHWLRQGSIHLPSGAPAIVESPASAGFSVCYPAAR